MIGLVELMHANEVSRSALPNSVLNHEREAMIEFGMRNAEFGVRSLPPEVLGRSLPAGAPRLGSFLVAFSSLKEKV